METRDARLREPDKPLAIVVTEAGSEILELRSLAKEALSMLLRPEAYSLSQRAHLAQSFQEVLEGDGFRSDGESDWAECEAFDGDETRGYEPGECSEWPEEEAEGDA